MKKLFVTTHMKDRRCPLTGKRCLAGNCALWSDEGFRRIYCREFQGCFAVGYCTLSRRRK